MAGKSHRRIHGKLRDTHLCTVAYPNPHFRPTSHSYPLALAAPLKPRIPTEDSTDVAVVHRKSPGVRELSSRGEHCTPENPLRRTRRTEPAGPGRPHVSNRRIHRPPSRGPVPKGRWCVVIHRRSPPEKTARDSTFRKSRGTAYRERAGRRR